MSKPIRKGIELMTKKKRGYFGLAIYHPKNHHNWGTLIRTANILGADFIATIGERFRPQSSDTLKSHKHVPVFRFKNFEEFYQSMPYGARLIGIELDANAKDIGNFKHPDTAVYLLGAEDHGLPERVMNDCHQLVKLKGDTSMNVAVAGSIVLYDRINERGLQ